MSEGYFYYELNIEDQDFDQETLDRLNKLIPIECFGFRREFYDENFSLKMFDLNKDSEFFLEICREHFMHICAYEDNEISTVYKTIGGKFRRVEFSEFPKMIKSIFTEIEKCINTYAKPNDDEWSLPKGRGSEASDGTREPEDE